MKIRGGESCISRRILLLCILLAVISQVGLCVNAKQRTKAKQVSANNESLAEMESNSVPNNIDKADNNTVSRNKDQEIITQQKNVRKEEEKTTDKQEKMGMIALVQKQVSLLKTVYMNYYSKLTLHLGGQKDIYVAIMATIIIFSIVFVTLSNNKQDFPFLRNLDLQQAFQTKAHLEKQKRQMEEEEQFYNSYNLSGSSNKSLNNSEGDSYLSASDYKLQRQQVDILNALEWQRMKDRAQKYSAFENNPIYQEFKMKSQQNNRRAKKIDETIDFNENNIDINDLLKELDNQSVIGSKNSCNSSQSSNILASTNAIVI